MLDRRSTILEIEELQTHLHKSMHTEGALMAMKKRLCALEDDRKFKGRKFEKFHAELIIRQQKCGKVDLKGLSRSQAEFLRREIWRKIEKQEEKNDELEAEVYDMFGPHKFARASQWIENIDYTLTWCKKNPI